MKENLINKIQRAIRNYPSNSAWDKGVKVYAEEILNSYIESYDSIEQITKQDLLNGAKDWKEYSHGGFSLIFDADICKRLCNPSKQKSTQYGTQKPNPKEDWMDMQARALQQAAQIITRAANTSSPLSRMSL